MNSGSPASDITKTNSSSNAARAATSTLAGEARALVVDSGTYKLLGNRRATNLRLIGSNKNGTSDGTHARKIINGHDLIVAGNRFNFRDEVGSITFGAAGTQGGRFDTIKVISQAGPLDLSGVDANGLPKPTDGVARISDQAVTGSGNRYLITNAPGSFLIEFTNDSQRSFDTISDQSNVADIQLQGGDSQGNSKGNDCVTMLNSVLQSKSTSQATLATQHGLQHLKFVEGFVHEIRPITVAGSQPNSGESTLTANGTQRRTDDANNSKLPTRPSPILTNSSDNLITQIVAGTAAAMQSVSTSKAITTPTGIGETSSQDDL